MENLSDDVLVESYIQARKWRLDSDFISILQKEIKQRGIYMSDNRVMDLQKHF